MTNWNSSKTGWAAGLLGMLVASLAVLGKVSEHVSLPERVKAVEDSTKSLAAGQQELTRRVDLMGNNIVRLQTDFDKASDKTEKTLADIGIKLSEIVMKMEDVRHVNRTTEKEITTVRQQAQNALSIADDANRRAAELEAIAKAKGTK